MRKKFGLILSVFLLSLLAVGGCARAQKDNGDKVYQDAFSKIQKKFSDYVVKNYEGVKKIEWDGVEIERYNSPIYGPSLFGNITYSVANIYVTDKQALRVTFFLPDLAEYDQESKQFVLNDKISPAGFDHLIELETRGNQDFLSSHKRIEEKNNLEILKKNTAGSPDAPIKYDLAMREVK